MAAVALALAVTLAVAEPTPPASQTIATPIVSSDKAVQKTLADFDRLLDASNPKIEEIFRQNASHLEEAEFRKSNPEIDVMLKQQPEIVPALRVERHFLLHRYIAHRAHGPLLRADVVALDEFLAAHPDIRQALNHHPSQILESGFLIANPSLGEFFDQHPSLSTILLETPVTRSGRKNK